MVVISTTPLIVTKHKELRVAESVAQDSITPASGKQLRIYGFQMSQMVTVNLNATLRASLSFGTGGVSDRSKVIASYRLNKADETDNMPLSGINILGEVDESITLTNITFSGGNVITRAVVYYNEE